MLSSAKDNLFLILSNFVTKGMELWCVGKVTYPVDQGASQLQLDVGWVDVEDALLRTVVSTDATALVAGGATYSPADAVLIASSVLELPAGSYSLVLEGSADGITWVQYGSRDVTLAARGRAVIDADTFVTVAFWRARAEGSVVVPYSATFCSSATEIPMTKLTRDDYVQMPNKAFQARPLQYWFDKQTPQTRFWLWPTSQSSTVYQCVVWGHRQIQDVGELSNTLDVPQRWLDAVISELATRVCLELPKELVPPGRYEQLLTAAERILKDVQDAEIDGSPVRLAVNIRAYTR